ncbi:MAG TPA: DUF2911 domain-containing protein [Terriglobales bacterium]|nr:DUF2911 domain-containing protein [Terriglobales bacterium]
MRRWPICLAFFALCFAACAACAQSADPTATAACNFDDDNQLAVNYDPITVGVKKKVLGSEIHYDKVWSPGGKPMTLFTNTPLTIDGKEVPAGAYTLFVIPREKNWTLIISKSTDMSGNYDESKDLMRVPLEFGQLPQAEPNFSVYFAHTAPKECNMRMDLQKARAWTVFQQTK